MFLWVYLAIYFALVLGAVVALWIGGVLTHLSAITILVALLVAIGLGVLLAVVWQWRPGKPLREHQ